jgi:hypothetical protein
MDSPDPPVLQPGALPTLRNLIERMDQHPGRWGTVMGGEKTGDRTFTMPYVDMHELAYEAMTFLYDHDLIISFDWPEWDEGREIFRSTQEDRIASLDRLTVLKLLSAVARNDRFCEGAWAGIFEDGSAQALFKRLLEIETGTA